MSAKARATFLTSFLSAIFVFHLSFVAYATTNFTTLYTFSGTDGQTPVAHLVQAPDGLLYGTTWLGGDSGSFTGDGTAFRISMSGSFESLYTFTPDESQPFLSGLTLGRDGKFYGTTELGGIGGGGVIFSYTDAAGLTELGSYDFFATGDEPAAGVIQAADGNFYGTASSGGTIDNLGTIFRYRPGSGLSRLFSFNGTNGAYSVSPLTQSRDNYLFGTTFYGGVGFTGYTSDSTLTGYGTIFRITTNGAFTSYPVFRGTNGAGPVAALLEGPDGLLYGSTEYGGQYNYGTLFRFTRGGALTVLHSFRGGAEGGYPCGKLVLATDGNFYGTTADTPFIATSSGQLGIGYGTVFRLTPDGAYTKMYTFRDIANGVMPVSGLIQATDGNFYGVTDGGGQAAGVVYRLSLPIAAVIKSVSWASGTTTLTWTSSASQSYQLLSKPTLGSPAWIDVGAPILATDGITTGTDPYATNSASLYRVLTLP